jgi:hypothetical protein
MTGLYSRRASPQPDAYRYDIPENVRWRILHTMKELSEHWNLTFDLGEMLGEVRDKLLQQYGSLYRPMYDAACVHNDPLLNHFLCCPDDKALDFIEACFHTRFGCGREAGVKAINQIFQEEAIGYELTAWREIETDEPARLFGRPIAGKSFRIEFPRIIRKDEQFTHREIVQPCLAALGHPKLQTANSEMLSALEEYREGKYADALTSCGSAFESVLKTICEHHGWTFDPDKDTCSKLVGICRENNLFPPFYAPIFEATGTIRNKLGDAHGRGPAPMYAVGKEHVDHMIQLTSAHIVLLVGLAKL